MILLGTRGRTTILGRGTFACPSCGPGAAYEHKRVRSFFALYFIPLVPLKELSRYVECRRCRATFPERIVQERRG